MKKKVLIVEDEMLVAMELEAIVEDFGFECVGIAPDAATALRLAETQPDIALVDVNLRDGETGPEIAAHLAELHDVAVIFVTGNPRAVHGKSKAALGALGKPVVADELGAVLDYATARRVGLPAIPPMALLCWA
jgi:DNA-binding NarL/FixJ family response regulator